MGERQLDGTCQKFEAIGEGIEIIDQEILDAVSEIRERLRLLEKNDSVSISKGMAGKYSWDVKLYGQLDDDLKRQEAINRLGEIDAALKANKRLLEINDKAMHDCVRLQNELDLAQDEVAVLRKAASDLVKRGSYMRFKVKEG